MSTYKNLQVWFGNNNLSNKRLNIQSLDIISNSARELQTLEISRGNGTNVIRSRYKSKTISIGGGCTYVNDTKSSSEIQKMTDLVKNIFSKNDRLLRIIPENKITYIDTCQTVDGWIGTNDANNIILNEDIFSYDESSVFFDVDVSASANNYATLTKTASTGVDLSSFAHDGSFDFEVYLSDSYWVNSIEIKIGSDSSNYYSGSFNTNYEGKNFENGFNLLSLKWGDDLNGLTAAETGTVDNSDIKYYEININYSASATDFKAGVGSIAHTQEDWVRNYPCYLDGEINFEDQWYLLEGHIKNDFDLSLLNYTGYSQATHSIDLFNVSNITTVSNTQKVDLKGTFEPKLNNTFTLNDTTNLTDLRYSNLNLNETIRWTNTWTDNDIVRFDTLPLQVTRNGEPQDFEGKLPSAITGVNYLRMSVVTGDSDNIDTLAGDGTSQNLGSSSGSFVINAAQSILTTTAGTITQVQVYVSNLVIVALGTLLRCSVKTDNSGEPGTLVGNFSTNYTGNPTLSTPQLITFTLDVPVSNATTYWIEISPNTPFFFDSATIYGSSSSTYANGQAKFQTTSPFGGNWVDDSNANIDIADLDLSVLIEPTPSTDINWRCNYKPLYL